MPAEDDECSRAIIALRYQRVTHLIGNACPQHARRRSSLYAGRNGAEWDQSRSSSLIDVFERVLASTFFTITAQ